jgi:hypothetical protein
MTPYRSRLTTAYFLAAGVWIIALMVFILALGEPRGIEAVEVALGLVAGLWSILRLSRCGIYADDHGILILNPLSSTRLRWDEIRRFAHVERSMGRVVRMDGSGMKAFGLRARAVDRLNRRLEERLA